MRKNKMREEEFKGNIKLTSTPSVSARALTAEAQSCSVQLGNSRRCVKRELSPGFTSLIIASILSCPPKIYEHVTRITNLCLVLF